ncbi:ABC transporter permease [Fibrisoma montanum]|uniref:ABC transporter permease n=1 Tax=Fibrisoma montanum TaxID=2305895 RepID=A0A418LVH2_9BACT|nr:ABC transporter permease [Fibrisoma montanum]RIV17234.1 ABC transporter permease [Fibrisoma montanum]
MLKNYLKTALRSLLKNKMNTAINITGLSIGMVCCILIVMYVTDELSYDRYWANGEQIYRMALERRYPDRSARYAIIPASYAQDVKREIPEVAESVRLISFGGNAPTLLKYQNQTLEERHVMLADSSFFRVFQVPLLEGKPDLVLNRPNTVVLTQSTAKRIFGNANPIGKTLEIVQGPKLEVTGICEDLPKNVHFTFDFLASARGFPVADQINHISFSSTTYLRLRPNANPDAVQAKFPALVAKYAAGEVERNFGVSYDQYLKAGNGYFYFLQPLRSIHLDSNLESELQPNGNRTLVYMFMVIAGFVLLIACINFMNLATARSSERAKEVGIRKSLGSTNGQLAAQFLTESVLLSLFSFTVAIGLVIMLLPLFNELARKELSALFLIRWTTLPVLFILALLVGLLAGSYPAGVLSSFEPIKVLKGKFFSTRQGHLLRNGLVVFQFAISIILIISTLIVYRQLHYVQNKALGFAKEAVITVQGAGFLGPNTEAFKQDIGQIAGVQTVGGASAIPGQPNYFGITFRKEGDRETVTGRGLVADDQYLQTMQMTMTAGRPFSRAFNDSLSVVINEEAAKELGLADPIGKRVVSPDDFGREGDAEVVYTVVGVVKNFHFTSLHQRIAPLFIINDRWFGRNNNQIVMRIQSPEPQAVLARTEGIWKRYLPDQPFHYSFLESDWGALYQSEQVSQRIFGVFSLLAILIACMGLLGLAIYIIQQRTKEIGVRKVLGASIPGIVALLSKDFLKLVFIAFILASPVAWYAMNRWLQDFAYKIDIEWWVFAVAGVLAVGIALLTVSYQSVKAALMNPVKSLRAE